LLVKIFSTLLFIISFILNYTATIQKNLFDFTNSDLLYAPLFSEELWSPNYSIFTWDVPPAPYFFPDIFITSAFHVFGNLFLFSFLPYSILVSIALIYIVRKINPKISLEKNLLFQSILLSFVSLYPESLGLLYFPTFHTSAFLICLYYFSFTEDFQNKDLILIFLVSISDKTLFSIFFIPMGIMFLFEKKYKRFVTLIFIIFLITITLTVLEKYSLFNIPKIPIFNELKRILKEKRLFENFYLSFKITFSESKSIFLFITLSTLILLKNIYTSYYRRMSILLFLSIFIQIFVQISFGIPISFRYNWFLFIIPFLSFIFYFDLFSIFFLPLGIGFLIFAVNKIDLYIPKRQFINCLLEKKQLKHGISDYWNSKYIRFFSKNEIEVNSVFSNIEPYHWIQNREWLTKNKKGESFNYQFILPERLNQEIILQKYGHPAQVENCIDKEIWIYAEGKLKL
jgi:hypothetical protein